MNASPDSVLARGPPRVSEALGLFGVALALLLVVGAVTQRLRPGPLAVAVTEFLAILLPALLYSRARRRRVLFGLGLWPLSPRLLLAGLFLGAAWFYVLALLIEPLLDRILPLSEEERRRLLVLLLPPGGPRPLWQDLACFAAAPALCEEVLFRGVLLPVLFVRLRRSTGRRGGALLAVLATSLLFGAFHLSPGKILPTAILGLGFGLAAILAGSLWPSIAMHFCNNALVVLLVRAGFEEPPGPSLEQGWAGIGLRWLLVSLACAALGTALLWSGRRAKDRPGA